MSHVANPFVVVLDANVLHPYRVRDVLLRAHRMGVYRAPWTSEILDEWERSVIGRLPHHEESIASQRKAIERVFQECFVTGYKALIASLDLPDEDDRHVLAAAIKCSAQLIVTDNVKDFPADVLDEFDIATCSADDLLSSSFELFPVQSVRALASVRGAMKNPPLTRPEFLTDLTASGLPRLARMARTHIDSL